MKNILKTLILFVFISCSDSNTVQDNVDSFDRSSLLSELTNNLIVPAHDNFALTFSVFESDFERFSSDLSIPNLQKLRSSFIDSYMAWQHIEMFNIGKAEEIYYNLKTNSYPTNILRIDANKKNNSLDLDIPNENNYPTQGFPAVDYFLFGIAETDEMILNELSDATNLSYLNLLVQKISTNSESVINFWKNNSQDFANSADSSQSSNLNMLANDFVYYYEKGLRANKIGIPAGRWSNKLPNNVEAVYSKVYSKNLAIEGLKASKNFFLGLNFNTGTPSEFSFRTYVDYLDTDNSLSDLIIESFDNSMSKLQVLNDDFSYQVDNNNSQMLEAYDAIQEGVVYLKTDMLSLLSISVDYMDADGD